jgi:hypothetical protein
MVRVLITHMLPEEWRNAKVSILDRMSECGWITGYDTIGDDVTFEMTPLGRRMIVEFFKIISTGGRTDATEIAAFFEIVRRVEFPDASNDSGGERK